MLDVLFEKVLSCSGIGSYVIVSVMVARLFLKKSPKIYSYALWSVVFFRLLVPFTLESPFGILPVTPESPFAILSLTPESPFGILSETQSILPMNPEASTMSQVKTENQVSTATSPEVPFSSTEFQGSVQNSTSVWSILWCVGMSVLLIPSLCSVVKLHKQLRVSFHLEKNIYLVDSIDTPFVWGFFKPKIYLPSTLSDEEKACVVPHEEYHLKRLDHLTRLLAFFTLILHWFNPLVWCAFVLSGRDMELSVDEKVVKNLVQESPSTENESTIKQKYATLLLELGTKKSSFVPLYVTPTFRHGETKERVNHVMKIKNTKLWVSGLTGVLVLGLIVGFTTSRVPQEIIGVVPENLEHNMLLHYSRTDGVEETLVYRLWDNETVANEFTELLANQGYYLMELEEDPEKLQEMRESDIEQIMLWGEYGAEIMGIMSFDLGRDEATVVIGNSFDNMHSGMGEMENHETVVREVFQLFEKNKETLHQVEMVPEKLTGEESTLVATLNGLTYEVGENFYLTRPIMQAVGGSHFNFITEDTQGSLIVRVSRKSTPMPEENRPEKQYLFQEYEEISSGLIAAQFGNDFVTVYLDKTGFYTEPCYLPFVSANGEEYLYQIQAQEEANSDEEPKRLYITATFFFQEYEFKFEYTLPCPIEEVTEWTETLFDMANSFEIDPDGLHTRDYIWSDYQYIS